MAVLGFTRRRPYRPEFFAAFIAVVWLAPPGERLAWLAVPGQMALLPLLNVAMERRARRFAAVLARTG